MNATMQKFRRAQFTAVFDKGSAQIFPDMLSIMSGVPVTVPFLNRTAFQLAASSRLTTNPSAFLEAKRDLKVGCRLTACSNLPQPGPAFNLPLLARRPTSSKRRSTVRPCASRLATREHGRFD